MGGGKGPREQQSLQVSHSNEEGRRWDRGPPGCCSRFCEGYEINKHPGFQTHSQDAFFKKKTKTLGLLGWERSLKAWHTSHFFFPFKLIWLLLLSFF